MAFPVIQSTTTGVETTPSILHEITMPSGINANDLIMIFISCGSTYETERMSVVISETRSSNNWHIIRYNPSTILSTNITILYCYAKGSSLDYLAVWTRLYTKNSLNVLLWGDYVPVNISQITYLIRGHSLPESLYTLYSTDISGTSGLTANWIINQCPASSDYYILDDYLWIITAATTDNNIATAEPSSFSTLITAQGQNNEYSTSLSSCYRELRAEYHPQTSFVTAPMSAYSALFVRIVGGSGTASPGGFGIYVRKDSIGLP